MWPNGLRGKWFGTKEKKNPEGILKYCYQTMTLSGSSPCKCQHSHLETYVCFIPDVECYLKNNYSCNLVWRDGKMGRIPPWRVKGALIMKYKGSVTDIIEAYKKKKNLVLCSTVMFYFFVNMCVALIKITVNILPSVREACCQ